RVVPDRNEDPTGNAMETACERNGLAVVPGARTHDASTAFVGRQLRNQVQSPANLERAGGIVIFVLHPCRAAQPLVEQRVAQERSALDRSVDPCARIENVLKCRLDHHDTRPSDCRRATYSSRMRTATSGRLLIRPSTPHS